MLRDFIVEGEVQEPLEKSMTEREGSGFCHWAHKQGTPPLRRKTLLSNHWSHKLALSFALLNSLAVYKNHTQH